jgi:hypothetical protein
MCKPVEVSIQTEEGIKNDKSYLYAEVDLGFFFGSGQNY